MAWGGLAWLLCVIVCCSFGGCPLGRSVLGTPFGDQKGAFLSRGGGSFQLVTHTPVHNSPSLFDWLSLPSVMLCGSVRGGLVWVLPTCPVSHAVSTLTPLFKTQINSSSSPPPPTSPSRFGNQVVKLPRLQWLASQTPSSLYEFLPRNSVEQDCWN